jgi:hypothetical protein
LDKRLLCLFTLGDVAVGGAPSQRLSVCVDYKFAGVTDPTFLAVSSYDTEFEFTQFGVVLVFTQVSYDVLPVVRVNDAGVEVRVLDELFACVTGNPLAGG